jgi:hypothetical protein
VPAEQLPADVPCHCVKPRIFFQLLQKISKRGEIFEKNSSLFFKEKKSRGKERGH